MRHTPGLLPQSRRPLPTPPLWVPLTRRRCPLKVETLADRQKLPPVAFPTSTNLQVRADLRAIGGSNVQTFYDNGQYGDAIAGDRVFSYRAQVRASSFTGTKTLPIIGLRMARDALLLPSITLQVNSYTPEIAISQVYMGGGNRVSDYKNDYVELFNRGSVPVSLAGWTLHRSSATSSVWHAFPPARCDPAARAVLPHQRRYQRHWKCRFALF
jgi:hypothetical protein